MKARINDVEIEGTPREMAELIQNIPVWVDIADIPNYFGTSTEEQVKNWKRFVQEYGIYLTEKCE